MQVVLFISILVAEVAASFALFRIDPVNSVCTAYPSIWAYIAGHLVASGLLYVLIALAWWLGGNQGAWDVICRTRHRSKVLVQGGLIGIGGDLVSSLVSFFIQNVGDGPHVTFQPNAILWLLLRAGLWIGAYFSAGGVLLWVIQLQIRSRRLPDSSR